MASQALYRKWRPQAFHEVAGQGHVTQTLRNALDGDRVAHAYLFTGPRGTGKTTTARLLAKAVNCQGAADERPCNECQICRAINEGRLLDLIEIDAASNTGVDDIRDLRDKVSFRPGEAQTKFYIIDEVHMLSNSAFNALLKTLEEPPPHVIFVLATTEPQKIPATVLSRCQRFDFRRIGLDDIVERLRYIAAQEGLTVEDAALEFIARQGSGSMRDAISLLDQIAAYGNDAERITLEQVQAILGAVTSESVCELVDSLVAKDIAAGLSVINNVVNGGVEPRQFAAEIVEYLRALLLVKVGTGGHLLNVSEEMLARLRAQAEQIERGRLIQATRIFSDAMRDAWAKQSVVALPQLPLELAFAEATSEPVAVPLAPESVPQSTGVVPTPAAGRQPSPPAATAPAEPDPSQALPVGDFTLARVQAQWSQVLAGIRARDKMAYGLFNSGKPVAAQGNTLELSFQSDLLKSRAEQQKNRELVEGILQAIFGQKIVLQFVIEERSQSATPQAVDASPEGSAQGGAGDSAAVENDPLVRTGVELGGQVAGTKPL